MGQQQLLLVILVTIIVGIATVVAINTFGAAADSANIDAVTNDMAMLASSAQSFYFKPQMLDGGGRTFDGITFTGLSFPASGVDADGLVAENENGRYVISDNAGQEFTVTAYPSGNIGYTPGTVEGGELTAGANGTGNTIVATVGHNFFDLNAGAD